MVRVKAVTNKPVSAEPRKRSQLRTRAARTSAPTARQTWPKVLLNELGHYHSIDGPAVRHRDGTVEYWVHGILHRAFGPSVIRNNGDEEYYLHGRRHCTYGPAVYRANGEVEYWVHGEQLSRLPEPENDQEDVGDSY